MFDGMAGGFRQSVLFVNQSNNTGDVCLFQTLKQPLAGASPIAWLVRHVFPTTRTTFQWMGDFYFVWSNAASTLDPGVIVTGSQAWKAGLSADNRVTLTFIEKAYTFKDLTTGSQSGMLSLQQDSTIPAKQALAGIGMDTLPTTLLAAQPNVNLSFDPRPRYWIAFGAFTAGQVVDPDSASPAEISFPPNVQSMTAIYTAENTWQIGVTSTLRVAALRTSSTPK